MTCRYIIDPEINIVAAEAASHSEMCMDRTGTIFYVRCRRPPPHTPINVLSVLCCAQKLKGDLVRVKIVLRVYMISTRTSIHSDTLYGL